MALYPPDGVVFRINKHCPTCHRLKPGRSKHCSARGACVARFDHYCIWINNSIGLFNTRYFLAFLVATSFASFYGAFICLSLVLTAMPHNGMMASNSGSFIWRWAGQLQYMLAFWPWAAGIGVFLAMAAWIVTGFAVLQMFRVFSGQTSNEVWKEKEIPTQGRIKGESGPSSRHKFYDRGSLRNFAEIMFPRHYLRQALEDERKNGCFAIHQK
jgi:palmitoyltransferase ZDHHC4